MLSKTMRRKALALLVAGGALFQFGGCVELAGKNVVIGMGRSLGNIPANLLNELFISPLIEGLLPAEEE